MGLVKTGITITQFDDTYLQQHELCKYPHEEIDFENLQHVNLYCEQNSLRIIQKDLQTRKQKGITFIGSGNYHYVSYLLLQEITEPFTLVLFDNHPDLGTAEEQSMHLLSCGTWVSYALQHLPLLQQIVIIGPTTTMPHQTRDPRINIFPFEDSRHYTLETIQSAIHTNTAYISIDKDVLNRSAAVTNWDQGNMNLETLTQYLAFIFKNKLVEGVDICGEIHISPVQAFLPDYQKIIQKNEEANLQILATCLKAALQHSKGA